jgi:hypothetical protein
MTLSKIKKASRPSNLRKEKIAFKDGRSHFDTVMDMVGGPTSIGSWIWDVWTVSLEKSRI